MTRTRVHFVLCLMTVLFLQACYRYRSRDQYSDHTAGGYYDGSCTAVSAQTNACYIASPVTGRGDIYAADIVARNFTPVTNSPDTDYSPVVSRDEQFVAFGRRTTSGKNVVCILDKKTKRDRIVIDKGTDDKPIGFSADARQLLVLRSSAASGLAKDISSVVVDVNTGAEKVIGYNATFDYDGTHVLYIDNYKSEQYLFEYDLRKRSRRALCAASFVQPIRKARLLVHCNKTGTVIVDNSGQCLRKSTVFSGCRTLAVAGEWIAGSTSQGNAILVEHYERLADGVKTVPLPSSSMVIDRLTGSDAGFTALVRHTDLGVRRESLMTTSPPFIKWESQFSITELKWD